MGYKYSSCVVEGKRKAAELTDFKLPQSEPDQVVFLSDVSRSVSCLCTAQSLSLRV